MKYIIYGLTDPDTQEVRYIGKSTSGMKRPMEHKKPFNLKGHSHKIHWIKQLIEQNKKYGVIVLEITETPEELNDREIFWINEYKNRGITLTNSTDGGEGNVGWIPSEETKNKMSQSRIKNHQANPEKAKELGISQRKSHEFIDGKECKHCADCEKYLPLVDFSPDSKAWDGHCHICKPCKAIRTAEYRELNPSEILSEDAWKESYKSRKSAMSEGAKAAYEANPELRANLSKKKSKAIVGIPVDSGLKLVEFESALVAYKEAGFNNTYISQAVKSGKPYKGYIWKFKS